MRLLLDTHVLLWWMTDDRRLAADLREMLSSSDADIAVSAASLWEIAIKRALGRIDVNLTELISAVQADGFIEIPVRFAHALVVDSLPRHHDDPFDRVLIAQAIADERRLVTRDRKILRYDDIDGLKLVRA